MELQRIQGEMEEKKVEGSSPIRVGFGPLQSIQVKKKTQKPSYPEKRKKNQKPAFEKPNRRF